MPFWNSRFGKKEISSNRASPSDRVMLDQARFNNQDCCQGLLSLRRDLNPPPSLLPLRQGLRHWLFTVHVLLLFAALPAGSIAVALTV